MEVEVNFFKELRFYFKNIKKNVIIVSIFVLLIFIISLLQTPTYKTSFSFYQKESSQLALFQQFSGLGSNEDLSLKSLISSPALLRHVASKKLKDDKLFWQIEEIDQSLKNKILDSIFYPNQDLEQLYFDRSVYLLSTSIISYHFDNEQQSIVVNVTYSDKEISKIIANEIVQFVNDYYALIFNQSAEEKNEYIKIRMQDVDSEINNIKNELVEFKEKNININSPQLLQELSNLESDLRLKNTIYAQLFSQYELFRLDSIDKSNSVFLIGSPYTSFKPHSPNIRFNILISLFFGFFLTFFLSIKSRNEYSFFGN